MDQVKEFLRQCVKYRFWISLGVAALFAIIAYFLGSGPVQRQGRERDQAITHGGHKDVKQYAAPGVPNDQYKPIVDEKTEVLTKDVNRPGRNSTPPGPAADLARERRRSGSSKWGRKWPENVAESAGRARHRRLHRWPTRSTSTRSTRPSSRSIHETGEGVVSAPPKEALLRPVAFDINKLPELGKIWAAQERLWIQRTALDVVAQVNKNAKDWDSAIIKQINLLEVGNSMAQDQRSIAKGETLDEAEAIVAPGNRRPADDAAGRRPAWRHGWR